uniref:Uncharacterized protein n=2 Tax=unclassified Gammacoronavirus TaxID=1433214 RepID=A0AB39AFS2_9GAMC
MLDGGCSDNDWAIAYSYCFYWFCPIMDMIICVLLVNYLELLGLVLNNYLLWTIG